MNTENGQKKTSGGNDSGEDPMKIVRVLKWVLAGVFLALVVAAVIIVWKG